MVSPFLSFSSRKKYADVHFYLYGFENHEIIYHLVPNSRLLLTIDISQNIEFIILRDVSSQYWTSKNGPME